MKPLRFDRIAKLFAAPPPEGTRYPRVSRREAFSKGGAGLAAGALAAAGLVPASAQEATPDAAADQATPAKVPFLFVQTYQSGSITPREGEPDRYTLKLEQGHGQTIYFSDRPERIVGASPTPQFLEGLGFLDDNPPNAALVVETSPGETAVAVVELFNPLYDPVSQGVTYEVEVLANWQADLDMGFHEAPTDLAALAPAFGAAQLFIDDCPNRDIWCYDGVVSNYGTISPDAEKCWNYSLCLPCEPYGHTYPDYCAAYRYWTEKCNNAYDRCGGNGCIPVWGFIQPFC